MAYDPRTKFNFPGNYPGNRMRREFRFDLKIKNKKYLDAYPKEERSMTIGGRLFSSFLSVRQVWREMEWGKKKGRRKKVTFERETQIRKSPSSLSRHPSIHLSIGQAIVEEGTGGREIQFNIPVAT